MTNKDTIIIDDWLEPSLADFLSEYLLSSVSYQAGHKSNSEDEGTFLFGHIQANDSLLSYLSYKIKLIKPVEILRVYTNLHYTNMGGMYHQDDGDFTFIYMPSKGLKSDEASFEIKDEGKFEYKFNRLIGFDANKFHKGNAPKQNLPRITLAFKTSSIL